MIRVGEPCRRALAIFVLSLLLLPGPTPVFAGWACIPEEQNCRSVFVVHDSWHAAIVLRANDLSSAALPELVDFPEARYVEFSWGDKDYFPDPKSGVFTALKAAFWSSGSVLHLVGFKEEVGNFYPHAEITELRVSPSAYERLIGFIAQSFSRPHANRRAQASAGLYSYSRFYPSTGKFSVVNNTCNTWVARALEIAGLPVFPGLVISAAQLGDQLEKLKDSR